MTIEVTKETFYKIFDNITPLDFETKETHKISYFYNDQLDQQGKKIYNFASSQDGNFYLMDINA